MPAIDNEQRKSPYSGSLCRLNSQSCGACCWGVDVSRSQLTKELQHRQTTFHRLKSSRLSVWKLFLIETVAHRGRNLVWAILLRIPGLRQRLKRYLGRNLICAFVGFDSASSSKIGCLLHPSGFEGVDRRHKSAFRFLPGIECGDPKFECRGCQSYDAFSARQRAAFEQAVGDLDAFDYTVAVRAFSAAAVLPAQASVEAANSGLLPILPENANRAA